MNLDLTGKTALVTGSTAGIGLATATGLARQGATVVVNGRTQQRVDAAIASIAAAVPGARTIGVAADGTTADGAARMFAAVPEVDVLVNNLGGVTAVKPFAALDDADWQRSWERNVLSAVRFTRHYLPPMRARDWGRVVFVASESGIQPPLEFMDYGVAKAGVIALSRGIAESLVRCGVTANAVLPGPTLAEGLGRRIAESGQDVAAFSETFFATRRPTSLIQRFETVEEVAAMIVFVCTPAASAVHGAALRVDGGVIKGAF
ncbi:MAG: SDR family NAD(P)-dependent oxidoreductase [Rhodospirillales bacterium]|nr:SDR family NAD(P)-dependent oxidoreductase [Rhodospirillales bacterium]